ncbi:MAG: hypothetical protein K0B11_03670 [Mariniphaga sp.]|nr:hypothetical protein [Mariniphaga sp.]
MKTSIYTIIVFIFAGLFSACKEETIERPHVLDEVPSTTYFDAEIFAEQDLKIYGTWKIFDISGGIHGLGYEPNFDYLVIKRIGIYGFAKDNSLLEFGKIVPALWNPNDLRLKVDFEKDEQSGSFFTDTEKYVHYTGNDTLHLSSPCCDRFNYHFERVK